MVDLGPAQPPIVDIFLARYFPKTAQNKLHLDILWGNPGSKLYILLLIANLDTGRPEIPKLGKFNQRYFHEKYLKISLPILWVNLV